MAIVSVSRVYCVRALVVTAIFSARTAVKGMFLDQGYTPTQWSVIVLSPMDHACFCLFFGVALAKVTLLKNINKTKQQTKQRTNKETKHASLVGLRTITDPCVGV